MDKYKKLFSGKRLIVRAELGGDDRDFRNVQNRSQEFRAET